MAISISQMKSYIKFLILLISFVITAIIFSFFCKIDNQRRLSVQIFESDANSSSLELLLNMYYHEHGIYPPIKYQRNPEEPYHSWRVLLLKYMSPDWKDVYDKYDFSLEWNSIANLKVVGNDTPRYYYIEESSFETHYLAINPNDIWPFKGFAKARIFNVDDSHFILVEYPESDIHWAEPKF